jgi:serine/threonine protein kinase
LDRDARDWERVSGALAEIIELPEGERAARLDALATDDGALRRELESLLRAHVQSGPLDGSVFDAVTIASVYGATAASMAWSAETIGGRYHLEDAVGDGGMGVVVKAWDEREQRTVALKFLSSHLLDDATARERFRAEARAISSLDHPNVCGIYEMGEATGERFYIAMPYYQGETIAVRLARGPLELPDVVSLATQIAHGLAAAHESGIIHRDIKPANLIVTHDGVLRILDFGIAKLGGQAMTAPGFTPGTAAYMSPEQARAQVVDPRTDLWSLGVVMYEMLAGTRPFRGADARAIAVSICTGEAEPVRSLREDVPPELERLVHSCLSKDPAGRPDSAARMAAMLAQIADSR